MSEPHQRESRREFGINLLWIVGIIAVMALVKVFVLGHRAYDKDFQPHQPNYDKIMPQSTSR